MDILDLKEYFLTPRNPVFLVIVVEITVTPVTVLPRTGCASAKKLTGVPMTVPLAPTGIMDIRTVFPAIVSPMELYFKKMACLFV